MRWILIFLVLSLSLVSGCVSDVIYNCDEDTDCMVVDADCCGCNMGGEAVAINEMYLSLWNKKRIAECTSIMCAAVISDHWTCFAEPKCVEGRCMLVEGEGVED